MSRVKRLANLATVRSLGREAVWRLDRRSLAVPEPTWSIDPRLAAEMTIVWIDEYGWGEAGSWLEPLRLGLERQVSVRRAPTAHVKDAVTFLVERGSQTLSAAVEYGDSPDLDSALVEKHDLVFKMQYRDGGYGTERVVPGGYVARSLALYRYLPRLRALRASGLPIADVYGRFSGEKAPELRRRAIGMLSDQGALEFRGGLTPVRYLESLSEAARSTVCLDLPGFGPLCFRLVDYLAIGACIVGPPHGVRLHVPLEDDTQIVRCAADLSDLVEVISALAADRSRAARIGAAARTYFDRYLDYRQLSAYYLATIAERV